MRSPFYVRTYIIISHAVVSTPSLCHFNGLDVAVFVELHAVDADDAVVRALVRDWTAVVADSRFSFLDCSLCRVQAR